MIYLTQDLACLIKDNIMQKTSDYYLVNIQTICRIKQNLHDLTNQVEKYRHMGYSIIEDSEYLLKTGESDRLVIVQIMTDKTYNLYIMTNTELIDAGGFTELVNSEEWSGFDSGGIYDKYNNRLEEYKSHGIVIYADEIISKIKKDKFITFKQNLGKGKIAKLITLYNAQTIANQGEHTLVKYKSNNKTIVASDAEIILPVNCSKLFHGLSLGSFNFKELNTEFVIDMQYMFSHAVAHSVSFEDFKGKPNIVNGLFTLAQIDDINMEGLDTSNVVEINKMFYGTTSRVLDINSLNLKRVVKLNQFITDLNIESIDLRGMDLSNITKDTYVLSNIVTDMLDLSDCKLNMSNISYFMKDIIANYLILNNWTKSNREKFLAEISKPIHNNKIKEILGRCIDD